jgi:hypothetical protein
VLSQAADCPESHADYWDALTEFLLQARIDQVGHFKRLCHEMNNLSKVLKVKSVLYVYSPMVFNFLMPVMEKKEIQVFACFYENAQFEDPY